jgi:hypothetical protein
MHGPVFSTLSSPPRIQEEHRSILVSVSTDNDNEQHLVLHASSKRTKCTSTSIGILKQLLHDHHEMNLDIDSILQEEELLTSLLENVNARKDHLKREQSPLLALGEDILETMVGYLDPKDLCQAEQTCRTLRRSATSAWEVLDEHKCGSSSQRLLLSCSSSTRTSPSTTSTPKERVQRWYLASQ